MQLWELSDGTRIEFPDDATPDEMSQFATDYDRTRWRDLYNTDLGDREPEFQQWMQRQNGIRTAAEGRPRDISQDLGDYDLRGLFLEIDGADPEAGHGTDRYKKPNHPTFSDESIYHGAPLPGGRPAEGGIWVGLPTGGGAYLPSSWVLEQQGKERLGRYFGEREPGVALVTETGQVKALRHLAKMGREPVVAEKGWGEVEWGAPISTAIPPLIAMPAPLARATTEMIGGGAENVADTLEAARVLKEESDQLSARLVGGVARRLLDVLPGAVVPPGAQALARGVEEYQAPDTGEFAPTRALRELARDLQAATVRRKEIEEPLRSVGQAFRDPEHAILSIVGQAGPTVTMLAPSVALGVATGSPQAGAALGSVVEAGGEAGSALTQAREEGVPEAEARAQAVKVFTANLPLVGGSNALEAAIAFTPLGRLAGATGSAVVRKMLGSSWVRNLTAGAARAALDGFLEGQQELAQQKIPKWAKGEDVNWLPVATTPDEEQAQTLGSIYGWLFGLAGQARQVPVQVAEARQLSRAGQIVAALDALERGVGGAPRGQAAAPAVDPGQAAVPTVATRGSRPLEGGQTPAPAEAQRIPEVRAPTAPGERPERRVGERRQEEPAAEVSGVERRSPFHERRPLRRPQDMSREELEEAVVTDPMTGLGNIYGFDLALQDRQQDQTFTSLIDVDGLKWVNDNLGHPAGDEVIGTLGAAILRAHKATASVTNRPLLRSYRGSGRSDEIATIGTREEIGAFHTALDRELDGAYIEVDDSQGASSVLVPVRYSRGLGRIVEGSRADAIRHADAALSAAKARREQTGLRSPRGEQPPGIRRVGEGERDRAVPPAPEVGPEAPGPREVAPPPETDLAQAPVPARTSAAPPEPEPALTPAVRRATADQLRRSVALGEKWLAEGVVTGGGRLTPSHRNTIETNLARMREQLGRLEPGAEPPAPAVGAAPGEEKRAAAKARTEARRAELHRQRAANAPAPAGVGPSLSEEMEPSRGKFFVRVTQKDGHHELHVFDNRDQADLFHAKMRTNEARSIGRASGRRGKSIGDVAVTAAAQAGGLTPTLIRHDLKPGAEEALTYGGGGRSWVAGKEEEEVEPSPGDVGGALRLVQGLIRKLETSVAVPARELFEEADQAYGGTRAGGAYQTKDAYDALETALNIHLQALPEADPRVDVSRAKAAVEKLRAIEEGMPSQTVRSQEQMSHQQFSTPAPYAYVVNWVANLRPEDVVLEPSAGTGNLATFAAASGARVIANELSERRAALLRKVVDEVHTEDASQIGKILHGRVSPTVVVMNPPFSQTAGRLGGRKHIMTGAEHIQEALSLLQPGGRLVAIVGGGVEGYRSSAGMAMESAAFREWWRRIALRNAVRANVRVRGGVYTRSGTGFATRVLVIDKVKPTGAAPVTGDVDNLLSLIDILSEVRDVRPQQPAGVGEEAQPAPVAPSRSQEAGRGKGAVVGARAPRVEPRGVGVAGERGAGRVGPAAGGVPEPGPEPGGEPVREAAGGGPPAGAADVRGPGQRLPGAGGAAEAEPRGGGPGGGRRPGVGDREPGRPEAVEGRPVAPARQLEVEAAVPSAEEHPAISGVFEVYKPTVNIAGMRPHPTELAESSSMAVIRPPAPTYVPRLTPGEIESGVVSGAQLESVQRAGQAHEQVLPSGQRRGFYDGDGTGVGKGRIAAAIILDNLRQGRKRAVWLSATSNLQAAARRDWTAFGQDPQQIIPLTATPFREPRVRMGDGVLFATYATMAYKRGTASRLDQVLAWLGPDFDGVIILDEAHKLKSALDDKSSRKKASARAAALLTLQDKVPNARIVYMSATGATEVQDFAYASRLGLWGPETPFPKQQNFVESIASGGITAMELVAMTLKQQGLYVARTLSFGSPTSPAEQRVEQEPLNHQLTAEQREVYNKLAEGWQVVLRNIDEALGVTDAGRRERTNAHAQFWGTMQRFFNQVLTSMQMPTVLQDMERQLAADNSVVLQIVNTNEAAAKRQEAARVARRKQEGQEQEEEGEESLEDLDITPREILMQFVESGFPTTQYQTVIDENGNEQQVPVVDSEGREVENPEAVAMRHRLVAELGSLRVPEGPLEMLLGHFGAEKVAEVTGRKIRFYRDPRSGRMRKEPWSKSKASADATAFQAGKKRILVFSDAGGTGESYHADLDAKNQQRRVHYLVQAGWIASNAVQGLGRTHRSNQRVAPLIKLVTTDVPGHKRFISTIARRLAQLGALTKGESKGATGGLFSERDNLEGTEAHQALDILFRDIVADRIEGVEVGKFEEQTGIRLRNPTGGYALSSAEVNITRFLNRLLALDIGLQERVFAEYSERLDERIEQATKEGTLDTGVQQLKHDGLRVDRRQTVFSDPRTGATAEYLELTRRLKQEKRAVPAGELAGKAVERWVRSAATGRVFAVTKGASRTLSTGSIVDHSHLWGVVTDRLIPSYRLDDADNWTALSAEEARKLWAEQTRSEPEYREEPLHVVSGAILQVWDRLPSAHPRLVRMQTDAGERFIGRVIPPEQLENTMRKLGAEKAAKSYTPTEVVEGLNRGALVELANGWTIKRRRISGEWRYEVDGPSWAHMGELEAAGLFNEIVSYRTRWFVPADRAEEIIERLTRNRPVVDVGMEQQEQHLAGPGPMPGAPRQNAPRVPVASLEGGKPEEAEKLIVELGRAVDRPVLANRPEHRGARGAYMPASTKTSVRFHGDLDATAHEVAHAVDDGYGVLADLVQRRRRDTTYDPELAQFWVHGSVTGSGPHSRLAYRRAEGFAEWMRAWLVNPERARTAAPNVYALFTERVPDKVRDDLRTFGEGIRRWAGLTATQKVISNVEVEHQQRLSETLRGQLLGHGYSFETQTVWERLRAASLDDLSPVMKAVSTAIAWRGMDRLLPKDDPRIVLRNWFGWTEERAEDVFGRGVYRYERPNEERATGSFESLFADLDKSSQEALGRDFRDVITLLLTERVGEKAVQIDDQAAQKIEELESRVSLGAMTQDRFERLRERVLLAAEKRKARLAGFGRGIESDVDVARKARAELRRDPERYARLSRAAEAYRRWADAVLTYALEAGYISRDSYTLIKARNQHYVAMHRLTTEIDSEYEAKVRKAYGAAPGITRKPGSLERFVGTTRRLENPYVSLMLQTVMILREAERNAALRSFRDLLVAPRKMHEGEPIPLAQIGRQVSPDDKHTIKIRVKGEIEHWQFEEGVHEALKAYGDPGTAWKVFRVPAEWLRWSVVHSPPFMVRNIIRDALTRGVVSNNMSTPLDIFKGYSAADRSAYLRAGGATGHYFTDRIRYHTRMREVLQDLAQDEKTVVATAHSLARGARRLFQGSELVGRMAEYRAAFAKAQAEGMDRYNAQLYAANEARGLLDFNMAGSYVRRINQVIPFVNAAVQGVRREVVAARLSPGRFLARWGVYILVPKLIEYLWNSWDDDDNEEYRNQPAYIRDLFLNFKVGPDLWLRIPLGFDMAVFAGGVTRLLDYVLRDDKSAFDGHVGTVARALLPADTSAFAGPFRAIVEAMTNWDFFRGRYIIPPWERDLEVARRHTEDASRFGAAVQELVGLDGRQVDHFAQALVGDIARGALFVSDLGRPGHGDVGGMLRSTSGLFVSTPGWQSRDVQAALREAKLRGMGRAKELQRLSDLLKAVYAAEDARKRDRLKLQAIREAKRVRERLARLPRVSPGGR